MYDKCVNWALCNQNVCQLKGSLKNAEVIEVAENTELCQSNYTSYDTVQSTLICFPGPYINSTHVQTYVDTPCLYNRMGTLYTRNFTEPSQCGYPEAASDSICPLAEGDTAYFDHLTHISEFWLKKPKCHILNPYSCEEA